MKSSSKQEQPNKPINDIILAKLEELTNLVKKTMITQKRINFIQK